MDDDLGHLLDLVAELLHAHGYSGASAALAAERSAKQQALSASIQPGSLQLPSLDSLKAALVS
jgi:hypothetical protein